MAMPVVALDVFNIKHIQRISYSRNGDNFRVVARVNDQEVVVRLPFGPDILINHHDRRTVADGLKDILSVVTGIKLSEIQDGDLVVWMRVK